MLKNWRLAFATELSLVAVTFLPYFCNSTFAQKADIICSINTNKCPIVDINSLTALKANSSLSVTFNPAESNPPFNPPDNGGPQRTQGSGTRNN